MADIIIGKAETSGVAHSVKDSIAFNALYAHPAIADYFRNTASDPYERDKTMALFDSQIEFWTQRGNREKRDIFLAAKNQLRQLSTEYSREKSTTTSPIASANAFSLGNDNIFTSFA